MNQIPMTNCQPYFQNQNIVAPTQNAGNQEPQINIDINKEKSMAISFDIAAEYSAINSLNSTIVAILEDAKNEKNPERKKLLETRVETLNNMLSQREEKIKQMELIKSQLEKI